MVESLSLNEEVIIEETVIKMVSYKVLSRHNSYKDAVYKCMYVSLVHVCVF